ncbi:MAG: metallophosphoesterase family protein [Patescibacteria group bacterium]
MISILHTADLHLDWPFRALPAACRAARRSDLLGILGRLIELAVERHVQALVIAGDTFTGLPSPSLRAALVSCLQALEERGIVVFAVPGPDEARLGILAGLALPENVRLLGGEQSCDTSLPGLTVYGFPPDGGRPLEGFHCQNRPGLHLALAHAAYAGLPGTDGQAPGAYVTPEDIARSGLDYLALGGYHEHYACVHGGTTAVYPGAPARLSFGMGTPRSAALVGLTEGPPAVERVVFTDRAYLEFAYDLGVAAFGDCLADLAQKADPEACARVLLTGEVHDGLDFFGDRLRERCAASFFHLEVEDRTTIGSHAEQGSIEDLFARRCRAALAERTLSPAERAREEYAFRAGMIALRGGRL